MTDRPYVSLAIDALEELVKASPKNEVLLNEVKDELDRRSSRRADALRIAINEILRALRLTAVNPARGASQNAVNGGPHKPPSPQLAAPPRLPAPRLAEAAPPPPRPATKKALPAEGRPNPPEDAPLLDQLGRMRRRLLDLTGKNRLLNFRHTPSSCVRLIDESAQEIFDRITSGEGLRFSPLRHDDDTEEDEPELPLSAEPGETGTKQKRAQQDARAKAIAESLGFDPCYDLIATVGSASRRHVTGFLQTMALPSDLESVLRRVHQKARTEIQEKGANILHLMFGFVEWSDVPEGQTGRTDTRLAPLVLVPVGLERGGLDTSTRPRTYLYAVKSTGEDWDTNVTLQEKCRRELNEELPTIDDDEPLDAYFQRIEGWLAAKTDGWRLRRFVTLGLVSFGKILMWRDLDTKTWPEKHGLLQNTLLREILGDDPPENEFPGTLTGEYHIDEPSPGVQVPPIVVDADSSQHSVLIDVSKGKNLVVQGPPGTGKSQTIANLIAAEIHSGKRVLFVAEKKAALDVVHRRLTRIGLGPYCLALHSHTSDKKAFLTDLFNRLRVRGSGSPPRDYAVVQAEIEEHRKRLNRYVQRLNSSASSLGLTVFEVLWRARRLLDPLAPEAQKIIAGAAIPDALKFSRQELEAAKSMVRDFGGNATDVLEEAEALGAHPWCGVAATNLSPAEVESILEAGRAWFVALQTLETRSEDLNRVASVELVRSVQQLDDIASACASLSVPLSIVNSEMPRRILLSKRENELSRALEAVTASRESWAAIPGPWGRRGLLSADRIRDHASALEAGAKVSGGRASIGEVRVLAVDLRRAANDLAALSRCGASLARVLELSLPATPRTLVRLLEVVRASASVSDLAFALRSEPLASDNAGPELESLARAAENLLLRREELAKSWPPSLRPEADVVRAHVGAIANAPGFLPSLFSAKYRAAVAAFRTATGRKTTRATMLGEFRKVLEFIDAVARFEGTPGIPVLFGAATRGIDSPFRQALEARAWRAHVTELGQGAAGAQLVRAAWEGPKGAWREASALCGREPTDRFDGLLDRLGDLARRCRQADEDWSELPSDELGRRLLSVAALLEATVDVATTAEAEEQLPIEGLAHRLDLVRRARDHDESARPLIAELAAVAADPESPADCEEAGAALEYISALRAARLPPECLASLMPGAQADTLSGFRARLSDAVAAAEAVKATGARFSELANLDMTAWCVGATKTLGEVDVRLLKARLGKALASEPTLYTWARYRRSRATASAAGAEQVCRLVDVGQISPSGVADAFEAAAFNTVANAILRSDSDLARFSGAAHEQVRRRFAELDEKSLTLTAELIAAQLASVEVEKGVSYGRVSDLSEAALINQQAALQRPRVPIRDLFRRAGRAIASLKPCLMMSPQAIAQFLPAGQMEFDLVVMDEASQIRPEDALGAIARGKQLVVVGDPMQLGPTSFFDRGGDDDDNDDVPEESEKAAAAATPIEAGPSVLERSESILTAAQARYPLRMLRWHYRSRHPKLIAFSNREFYGEDLIVFPTPEFAGAKDGVFFHRLEGAVYEGHRNVAEAEAVVAAVRQHAVEYPEKSLMVATLNYHQADLIDDLLQRAEMSDGALADFRRRHADGPEPLDVKNLENVQGDERDVIMVSITFGPTPTGHFSRNFGPINQLGGERRLNVLFTRAKYRLEVFCSFDPRQLGVTDSSPRGLRVLHDYLRYAEDGTWATGAPSGREPDSDFELAIARALRARGYEVHPQVGVQGFWIDLGIVHPTKPGTYVLGVECDGASYHSARSARDRDRLRQRALEGYGWNIHRVWSTDWFRDPRKQVDAVVNRIALASRVVD